MRRLKLDIDAETYAQLDFGKDIEDLTAEELDTIPGFLLDDWQARQEAE